MVRIDEVIEHIDAAAIGDPAIDHAQLAVQAPPAARDEHAQAPQRREDVPGDTVAVELRGPFEWQSGRTHTVHGQEHRHTTRGCPDQRLRHAGARRIKVKDIGLQPHFMLAVADRLDQGIEIGLPALQQFDLVSTAQRKHAPGLAGQAGSENSAISGR